MLFLELCDLLLMCRMFARVSQNHLFWQCSGSEWIISGCYECTMQTLTVLSIVMLVLTAGILNCKVEHKMQNCEEREDLAFGGFCFALFFSSHVRLTSNTQKQYLFIQTTLLFLTVFPATVA